MKTIRAAAPVPLHATRAATERFWPLGWWRLMQIRGNFVGKRYPHLTGAVLPGPRGVALR